MRVCILFHKFQPENEGISISIDRLTKNLSNVEFHIISSKKDSSGEDILRTSIETTKYAKNVFLHRVGFINTVDSEWYPDSLDNFCFVIEQLHTKYKFDLIHSYYLTPNGYIGTLIAKKLGIPSLVGVRGNDLGRNYLDYRRLFLIYWTLQHADYLTFLNEDLRTTANIISPCKNKSKVVMNTAYFPYPERENKVLHKELIFGYWGDMKRKKGIIYFLDAITKIKNMPFAVKLLGDISSEERNIYEKIIAKEKLSHKVTFYSSIKHDQVADWVSQIDVFVFPTINDGCPNVLFEAMYLSKCIISTNITAVSQVFKEGEAKLVPPRDSNALSNAILYFIKNPEKVTIFGKKAKKALARCNVKIECEEYNKIYKKLVK
ncbi:MAG: glycosyltransferase [archaeon]|jgi:glycosyltransferase involved in cell wall biosynthesis